MAYINSLYKAMLVAEDVTEVGASITKDKCYVVQHYTYSSERDRHDIQMMDSLEESSYIDFVIRVADTGTGKQFYQHMMVNEAYTYSFLFNAKFNGSGRMQGYDDGMMVKGYIVDIEEDISASNSEDGKDTQVLMKVKLLLNSITYIGNETSLVLNMYK